MSAVMVQCRSAIRPTGRMMCIRSTALEGQEAREQQRLVACSIHSVGHRDPHKESVSFGHAGGKRSLEGLEDNWSFRPGVRIKSSFNP